MLSDWESDLTELSSDEDDIPTRKVKDEDEYIPSSSKRRKATTAANLGSDYKIMNALRPPRTTQYTAKSLYDQIVESTIDLDPEYQRDVVWPDAKQSGLIDSILRNYYIPPVIFAVTAREDGSELRTCIDGKQRLTSIANFFDGVIPHKDSKTNTKYWYAQKTERGPRQKVLPRQYQQVFANKQITCVEYETLTDDQEREIFQRVQLGVALTPAERLQALTGVRPTLVRQIQLTILGDDGFGNDLEWANGRGRDFQCLASIVYLIEQQTDTFPHVATLEKWLISISPLPINFESDIMQTFAIWVKMVRDKQYNMPFSKPTKVSPIEFTIIGLLIHRHKSTMSLMQLSNAIWAMRADVRKVHVDIRANTKVTKTMLTFLNKKIKTLDLGHCDVPATAIPKGKASMNGAKTGAKRKRPEPSSEEEVSESEDSNDDDDEEPLSRKYSAKKKIATSARTTSSKATTSTTKTRASSSTGRAATAKSAKALPATKATSSKPSASVSTSKPATSNSRVTVKHVTVSAPTKSTKTSPTVSQTPIATKKSSSTVSSPANGTPAATPTIAPQGSPSVKKTAGSSGSLVPLALPRRTPLAAGKARSVSTVVKTEPTPDSVLPSPAVPPSDGTAPPINDRLAVLRAAKASAGGRSFSGGSPVVPATSQSTVPLRTSPPNILDNVAPIVKQERTSLPSLDTHIESSLQEASAAHRAPSSSTSSRLPTPALPPPSARSTPAVSTPAPAPAPPPVQIQQANGLLENPQSDGSQIDVASIEALLRQHGIGTFAAQSPSQPKWKPAFSDATPGSSTPEDVVMSDATSRQASVPVTMSTEQVVALVSSMPPQYLGLLGAASQKQVQVAAVADTTVSSTPTPITPSAPPVAQNAAMKRSPSTPPVVPPSIPHVMQTPPPTGPPVPPLSGGTNGSIHPTPPLPTTLPPPPSLPPPPALPPPPPAPSSYPSTLPSGPRALQSPSIPPKPASPTLSVKSAASSNILARPMTERDGQGSNGTNQPRAPRSRWDDRDGDWDMDRARDREREWGSERPWDRDSRWSERTTDPRRRNSGGMRDWDRERSERDYDYDRGRSWKGRGRGRGWPRGW